MAVGHSEAEPFWVEFLRALTHRGLRGARLVISNAHEDLNAIVDKTINGKWQRCLVGLLKNAGGL